MKVGQAGVSNSLVWALRASRPKGAARTCLCLICVVRRAVVEPDRWRAYRIVYRISELVEHTDSLPVVKARRVRWPPNYAAAPPASDNPALCPLRRARSAQADFGSSSAAGSTRAKSSSTSMPYCTAIAATCGPIAPRNAKRRVESERITPIMVKPDNSSSVLILHGVEELPAGAPNSFQMGSQVA